MPGRGYLSTSKHTFAKEVVEAIDKLRTNDKFIREMRLRGFTRISRELVVRVAVLDYLKHKGILSASDVEGK